MEHHEGGGCTEIATAQALIDRRTALEATPARAARWIEEETDQTYQEAWDEAPSEDGLAGHHRELLLEAKVKFILCHSKPSLRAALESPFAKRPLEPEVDTRRDERHLGLVARKHRPVLNPANSNPVRLLFAEAVSLRLPYGQLKAFIRGKAAVGRIVTDHLGRVTTGEN